MKVRAKTNINRSSGWVFTGTEFEIRNDELPELTGMVEVMGEPISPMTAAGKPEVPAEKADAFTEEKPARNSRKRKTETV